MVPLKIHLSGLPYFREKFDAAIQNLIAAFFCLKEGRHLENRIRVALELVWGRKPEWIREAVFTGIDMVQSN